MSGEYMFGTHGDGHPCSEYCRNCFQKGLFTTASIDEQQKAIASFGRKGHANLSNLKRWMPAVQQAAWILDRCGYVILSTIDGNGFPRPVAIDVLRHDGIVTWMSYSGLAEDATDEEKKAAKAAVKESQKKFVEKLASYASEQHTVRMLPLHSSQNISLTTRCSAT